MKADTYYTPVKDEEGEEYLCLVSQDASKLRNTPEDCVEKDVTERYSGNFTLEKSRRSAA